jgi:hypothetical protein
MGCSIKVNNLLNTMPYQLERLCTTGGTYLVSGHNGHVSQHCNTEEGIFRYTSQLTISQMFAEYKNPPTQEVRGQYINFRYSIPAQHYNTEIF